MNRILSGLSTCFLVLAFAAPLASGQDVKVREAGELKYKVGQKWSYETRSGDEKSYLVIVKIDHDPKLGKIIHVAMRGLRMKNPHSPDGISENVNHMPFSQEAIDKSGLKLLKEKTDLPGFEEGYRSWREAFEAGRAGIYTITVAEAVQVMEASLNQ
jgi:hypothetical protein